MHEIDGLQLMETISDVRKLKRLGGQVASAACGTYQRQPINVNHGVFFDIVDDVPVRHP